MPSVRLASSVILTRGPEKEPEIFLVRRAPQLRFMGGYWAFPGGTIMQEDYLTGNDPIDMAFAHCALRELFEETGVLAGDLNEHLDSRERTRLRKALLGSSSLHDWLQLLLAAPAAFEAMTPVCNITTPPFSPVLYRTRFMHAPLPDGEEPAIEPGELVEGRFYKPAEAVGSWKRGEMLIAPPNLFLLQLMARHDLSTFKKEADIAAKRFAGGALHPVYFSPGIFMAPLKTPTLPPATTTNTLIIGTDTLYVIEPATPEEDEQAALFAKMDELIGEGKRFEAILLTHHHIDHVGAVNAVSQRYNLPVRAHPLTYDRISEGFHHGEPLHDGDTIELGTAPDGCPDWHLSVIHTPGHAVDHLCYYDSHYQSAIVGDMLSTVSTILIDPPDGHMRTYLDSLKRLGDYPIKTLYPSHGPVHNDGQTLVQEFLEHRQQRENRVIEALDREPQTLDELLPKVYSDVPDAALPIASRSLLAGLIKLEEDGLCEKSRHGWLLHQ